MSNAASTSSTAPPLSASLNIRLSTMMFLQYAIWGSWLLLLWPFLEIHRKFSPGEISDMFAVGAFGAILSPWVAGQIADRWFNTEKFLAISHIVGAVLIWQLADLESYWAFLVFSLLYSIVYTPTLALTNSLAFHHIPDRDRDFGRVRLWGTIGWIVAGISVGQWLLYKHTVDETGATERLVQQHLLDADGRKRLTREVELSFKEGTSQAGQKLRGVVYGTAGGQDEDADHKILVLNVGLKEKPELKAVYARDVKTEQPVLELMVRRERLQEVRDAIDQLEGGSGDADAIRKRLTAYSQYTLFKTKGGDVKVGAEVIVRLKNGDELTGRLLAQTEKVYVLQTPDESELTALRVEDIDTDRMQEGQPIIGTLKSENEEKIVVETMAGEEKEIPADDQRGREPYGVFTDEMVQAERSAVENAGKRDAFRFSAVLGLVMGLFCFMLPKTPPKPGQQKSATMEALGEIKKNPLVTLFLLAVPISCIHQFYFVHTSGFLANYQSQAANLINRVFGVGGIGLMTLGQFVEIAVLAAIPLVAKQVSRKSLLAVGIIAYGLRMFLFAYVDVIPLPEIVTLIVGVSLHGFCFGCFIFVAFLIVDEETTGDVRASAPSLFDLVSVGICIIVGSKIAGWVAELATTDGKRDYTQLFSVPMWGAVACLVVLLLFYPGGRRSAKTTAASD